MLHALSIILFFGVRPGKASHQVLGGIRCPYCELTDTLQLTQIPHYFHLFWIPLFRRSTQVSANCSHCRKSYLKEEFSAEMRRAADLG